MFSRKVNEIEVKKKELIKKIRKDNIIEDTVLEEIKEFLNNENLEIKSKKQILNEITKRFKRMDSKLDKTIKVNEIEREVINYRINKDRKKLIYRLVISSISEEKKENVVDERLSVKEALEEIKININKKEIREAILNTMNQMGSINRDEDEKILDTLISKFNKINLSDQKEVLYLMLDFNEG